MVKSFIASKFFINNIDSLNTGEEILQLYIESNKSVSALPINIFWEEFQLLLSHINWIGIRSLGLSLFDDSWRNDMTISLSDWISLHTKKTFTDDFVQDICFAEGYVTIRQLDNGTIHEIDCVSIYCHFDENIISFSLKMNLDLFGRFPHQQSEITHSKDTIENNINIIIQSVNELERCRDFSLKYVVCDNYPPLAMLIQERIHQNKNISVHSTTVKETEFKQKVIVQQTLSPIPESDLIHSTTGDQERLIVKLDPQIVLTLIRTPEKRKWKIIRSNTSKPIMVEEIIPRLPEKYR
ncbi:MAG: hypothetical protein MUC87_07930 [Bacteroidia bacterium]|jgi:hypothetical protein|nr:hypothetical protein [Bacteroidia bacterium]